MLPPSSAKGNKAMHVNLVIFCNLSTGTGCSTWLGTYGCINQRIGHVASRACSMCRDLPSAPLPSVIFFLSKNKMVPNQRDHAQHRNSTTARNTPHRRQPDADLIRPTHLSRTPQTAYLTETTRLISLLWSQGSVVEQS